MSPIHRDSGGGKTAGASWESLVERLIREAQERGEFDDLPYRGQPIPLDDDAAAGDLALACHVLRQAGGAPPWIETDKEVRRLLAARDAIVARAARSGPALRARDQAELRAVVEATNRAIDRLAVEAPTPAQQRRRLVLDDELAALAAAARPLGG